jgi:hypothetical protein
MLSRWHPIWLRCKGADPNGVAAYDVKGSCSIAALYSRASISEPDYHILPCVQILQCGHLVGTN